LPTIAGKLQGVAVQKQRNDLAAHEEQYCLFVDGLSHGRVPVRGGDGRALVFGTEREAQEALARIGLRRLQAFLDREIEFDEALWVEEYYSEVVSSEHRVAGRGHGVTGSAEQNRR